MSWLLLILCAWAAVVYGRLTWTALRRPWRVSQMWMVIGFGCLTLDCIFWACDALLKAAP